MKIKALKTFICLLAALLVLGVMLVSCSDGEETDTETTGGETTAETEGASGFAVVLDGTAATVVYPLGGEDDVFPLANELASQIHSSTGVKPKVKDDKLKRGESYDQSTPEILFGYTGYEESRAVYAELTDYSQCLVKVVGNKLCVASYDMLALEKAMTRLSVALSNMMNEDNDIIVATDYVMEQSGAFTLTEAKLPILADAQPLIIDQADSCYELVFEDATQDDFTAYIAQLEERGYSLYTENTIESNLFKTYKNDKAVVNVSYTKGNSKMYVIVDMLTNTALPGLEKDNTYDTQSTVSTLFTQIGLYTTEVWNSEEDKVESRDPNTSTTDTNGMSYVIRLADGSFIVIDGGHGDKADENIEGSKSDAQILYDILKKQAPDPENITIAAWIVTHAHGDHANTLAQFAREYSETVELEQLIFNFPTNEKATAGGGHVRDNVLNAIGGSAYKNTPKVKAHVGQLFFIRNAEIEILCNLELIEPFTMKSTDNSYNNTSIVFTVEIEDTKIMMLGDCYPEESKVMRDIYTTETLKSDIVQVAHHGIDGVTANLYTLIDADYAFWPAGDWVYANYEKWGFAYSDMRDAPHNSWFKDENNISPDNIYLARDDIYVATLSDGNVSVSKHESAAEYVAS